MYYEDARKARLHLNDRLESASSIVAFQGKACILFVQSDSINNGVMGGYTKKQPIATEKFGVHRLTGDYAGVVKALGGHAE